MCHCLKGTTWEENWQIALQKVEREENCFGRFVDVIILCGCEQFPAFALCIGGRLFRQLSVEQYIYKKWIPFRQPSTLSPSFSPRHCHRRLQVCFVVCLKELVTPAAEHLTANPAHLGSSFSHAFSCLLSTLTDARLLCEQIYCVYFLCSEH